MQTFDFERDSIYRQLSYLNKFNQRQHFDKMHLISSDYHLPITTGNLSHLAYIARSSSEGISERLTPYTSFVDCTTFWNIRKIQIKNTLTMSKESLVLSKNFLSNQNIISEVQTKTNRFLTSIHSNLSYTYFFRK